MGLSIEMNSSILNDVYCDDEMRSILQSTAFT